MQLASPHEAPSDLKGEPWPSENDLMTVMPVTGDDCDDCDR
jgi:hypothetical protein